MEDEYILKLRKKIGERKEQMSLLYSKLDVKKKIEKEIWELKNKIENLDRIITAWSPNKSD